MAMNELQMGLIKEAPSDRGLIGYHHQPESHGEHLTETSNRPGKKVDLARVSKIMTLNNDRPIAIQQYEWPPLHLAKPVAKNDCALA